MNDILVSTPGLRQSHKILRRALWTLASSVSLGGLYFGRLAAEHFRLARLEMALPNLPEAFEGCRLVHLSDLHCSPIVTEHYLRECIGHVNDLDPDFVVLTGDFITGGTAYAKRIARVLAQLKAGVARVACLGNHDYGIYHPRGSGHMRQLSGYLSRRLFDAGVHVLRNQHAIFRRGEQAIQFVGLEDLWSPDFNPQIAFAEAHRDIPTIALSHNPDTAREALNLGAHWVLSGHTHGSNTGDNPFADAMFPMDNKHFTGGYYNLGNGHLYVNRGLSYARRTNLNRRPEITLFELRRQRAEA